MASWAFGCAAFKASWPLVVGVGLVLEVWVLGSWFLWLVSWFRVLVLGLSVNGFWWVGQRVLPWPLGYWYGGLGDELTLFKYI